MTKNKKWWLFSVLGLVLIGTGLSLFGEAVIRKYEADHWQEWFWIGTLSLVVINTGISFIGQAVIYKVEHKHYHYWHRHHKSSSKSEHS